MRSTHKLAILCTTVLIALNAVSASTADLKIFPSQSSTKVDSFTSYEVEITNTGTAEDIYDITSSNPSEIRIAPREVPNSGTLEPGQSETIQVWYNPDTGSSEGSKEFTVTATSQANREKYSTQGTVEIIKDHQVNIQVEGTDSVCRGEEAVYEVSVTNTGTQAETFNLQADAGDFSQNSIELGRNETETVELVRSSDIAVTDRSFNINAESTSSYADAFTSTSFKVETCYESEASLNPQSQRTAALTESELEVEVSNQGTRSDTFNLTTTHGELEQETVDVASGDTVTTDLTYTPEQPENKNIKITTTGESTSTASSTLNVYNGQNVSVNFESSSQKVCEQETFEKQVTVENTGAVEDTYTVETSQGSLSENEVELETGETRDLEVDLNSSNYEVGSTSQVEMTAQSNTFDQPNKAATSSFTVENCHDLQMDVVPNIQSAGENRSVLYEIELKNTGTQRNEYTITNEGPDYISIKPETVNVQTNETETSFIYAGIPYDEANGAREIRVQASGEMVQRQENVTLKIGEEVKKSLKNQGGRITGMFSQVTERVSGVGDTTKLAVSILAGLLISALVLKREW
ncbi:hypothetical protein GLU64_00540 [Nanohaloarchaea archaeon]|nr:hypothetical protein [Candidatus Nanohaloarchaea archaeon]